MEFTKLEYVSLKNHPEINEKWVQDRIAEDITSRFLNVISLFNGQIPLIAIQMKAVKINNKIGLIFTKVLNQSEIGFEDEDYIYQETTDRAYWEARGSKKTVSMADELLDIAKQFDADLQLKYNKIYIGLAKKGIACNFISFKPKKEFMRFEARLDLDTSVTEKLEEAGLDVMEYDKRWKRYRVRLQHDDIKKHQEIITWLIEEAYKRITKE